MIGRRGLAAANPKLELLDQVREVRQLKQYWIVTETAYCDWIRRYMKLHEVRSRERLDTTSIGRFRASKSEGPSPDLA